MIPAAKSKAAHKPPTLPRPRFTQLGATVALASQLAGDRPVTTQHLADAARMLREVPS